MKQGKYKSCERNFFRRKSLVPDGNYLAFARVMNLSRLIFFDKNNQFEKSGSLQHLYNLLGYFKKLPVLAPKIDYVVLRYLTFVIKECNLPIRPKKSFRKFEILKNLANSQSEKCQ